MATLRERLTDFMRSEKAQALAQYAPLGLLAAVSGSIIGAAVGAPAFAASGLGMALTGLATNLASATLYDAIRPDVDDDARGKAIQAALAARDPHVTALVADALAALGPQLALALAQRPSLLPALGDGMRQAGGVLAAVEPELRAALADPQADWGALQQQVARHITSVEVAAETSDEARMINQEQRVENAAGPVKLCARAGGRSVMEGGKQIVTGMAGAPASGAPPRDRPPAAPGDDPRHLRTLLAATIARLEVRELQRAQYGIDAPPHVVTELEDLRAQVAWLRARLGM